MDIETIISEAHRTAEEHGWHDRPRTFGDCIALLHSELSEALDEYRRGNLPAEIYYPDGEKPEGIPVELADVVIRMADMCGEYKINLSEAIAVKLVYNRNRTYRHGSKVL